MRDVLKTRRQWSTAGWLLPLVLLALPNCTLDSGAFDNATFFNSGPGPATSAIMCDIPKPNSDGAPTGECATQDHVDAYNDGFLPSLDQAATWLAMGKTSEFVLDWSQSATDACDGKPKIIEFFGNFPDGLPICLNCAVQIPAAYADTTKACIAKCKDLINATSDGVFGDPTPYCAANARTATNYDKSICYDGFCTEGGNPILPGTFADPRREQEPVVWIDRIGTDVSGANNNPLTRIDPTTPGMSLDGFDRGAASAQIILKGDAWVEFSAPDTTTSRLLAVWESRDAADQPCTDPVDCPDTDPSLYDFPYSLDLAYNGQAYVVQSGPPVVPTAFGTYSAGQRYRVRVTDNHDGTATLSYSRIIGVCPLGTECEEDVFFVLEDVHPRYPLRVDTSFYEQGSTLSDVTIVRIKQ